MRANVDRSPDTIEHHLDDARYFGTLADDLLHALCMAGESLKEPERTGILAIERALGARLGVALQAIEKAQDLAKEQP